MGFSFAQKKEYWAKQKRMKANGGVDPLAPPKPAFKRLETPSCFQVKVFEDIEHGSGHTVVDAVAGSGKTTTLLNGLFYIPKGKSACFCAFGSDIAEELRNKNPVPGIDIATTHSFGFRAAKRKFPGIKLDKYKLPNAAVELLGDPNKDPEHPDEEKAELIKQLCKCVGLAKQWLASSQEAISDIIDRYAIEFAQRPEDADSNAEAAEAYDQKRAQFVALTMALLAYCQTQTDIMDFDDMIWFPNVFNIPMDQFDVVFVDETQDLNKCQIELVKKMVAPKGRIIAVGDERQAIYLFRGADSDSIKNLVDNLGAKRLPLSVTYRCCKAVVQFVKDTVPGFEHLQTPDSADDGLVVEDADCGDMMEQAKAGDFIISRTNAPLIGIAMRFIKQGKPCNIRGRDIGGNFRAFIKSSKCKEIGEFMEYTENWRDKQVELLQKKMQASKKAGYLETVIEMIQDKSACLLALTYGCRTIKDLFANIDKMFSDKDAKDMIILGTTHKLKGLERERVFMLASTYKPGKGGEEDNLFYVAATRAKQELVYVTGPIRLNNEDEVPGM